ncbi:MAG: hypothetical protein INF48_06715 [Rhodobacter sp.]|nr:hypothetical protein [Rhodobacter sp.]
MTGRKLIRSTLIALAAPAPAIAEVCDKERPAWNPQDGPVSQLDDLGLFFSDPLGLTVLAMAGACILFRKTWFTALVITFLITVVALLTISWSEDYHVKSAAVSEGCLTTPVLTGLTLVAISVFLALLSRRTSRATERPIP